MQDNGFFDRMCRDAIDELAKGEKGWKSADSNTLFLACFGMLNNHLSTRIVRPLWVFASSVLIGVVSFILLSVLGLT